MEKLYRFVNPRNNEEAPLLADDVYDIIVRVSGGAPTRMRVLVRLA